ncbi:MAG TPA: D-alanyl-D-alanine carboxypeptidase family protein [Desulfitobacteriaceae bacterium]|jgi:D-alanyl-D-alanine carboxypeptidase (penicillin-binding protein 5/6)|nr:D-alanyl-D-alanine carboxypeptidase family protein [Desulfitobacteriaceae bacterium]
MARQKRTQTLCCVFLLVATIIVPVNEAKGNTEAKSNTLPKISAESAVLMDVITGDVLFNKEAYKRNPPASTTKIMTAILGLELGHSEEVVTVSPKAAAVGQATLHLDPGEKLSLYELISGALIRSGNDACVAIAEHIAGSEQQFLKLMNKKALLLGAHNTHFENTNGLPNKEHYSSAYDLALMACYGLQLPTFASITRLKETNIHFMEPDSFMNVRNTNKLLWNYPLADGVKTGTTTAAGKCLVASATKEGRQLVATVLNAPDRFGDAKKLLEWGFENTEIVKIAEAGDVVAEFPLKGLPAVKAFIESPLMVSIQKSCRDQVETRIIWERNQSLPINTGEKLGSCEIRVAGQKIKTIPLLSEQEVKKGIPSLLFNLN